MGRPHALIITTVLRQTNFGTSSTIVPIARHMYNHHHQPQTLDIIVNATANGLSCPSFPKLNPRNIRPGARSCTHLFLSRSDIPFYNTSIFMYSKIVQDVSERKIKHALREEIHRTRAGVAEGSGAWALFFSRGFVQVSRSGLFLLFLHLHDRPTTVLCTGSS